MQGAGQHGQLEPEANAAALCYAMGVQLLVDAYHARNESSIRIVSSDVDDHASVEAFYAAVVAWLNDSWDTPSAVERHIRGAAPRPLSIEQLRKVVAECVAITPIADGAVSTEHAEEVTAFRDEWNGQEVVWKRGTSA